MNGTFESLNAINIKDTKNDYAHAFKIYENSSPFLLPRTMEGKSRQKSHF